MPPVYDIYSKRKKRAEQQGSAPEVYRYDELPTPFRIQVIHIWCNAIGTDSGGMDIDYSLLDSSRQAWSDIREFLVREYGVHRLGSVGRSSFEECTDFIQTAEIDRALDIIELTFKVINSRMRKRWKHYKSFGDYDAVQSPDSAIKELNKRFLEHSIGYQFVDGRIIRMDSEFTYKEVILPAIRLIKEAGFSGAEDEFMQAHEHYRHADYKEALNNASKAFESALKSICNSREWKYEQNATAIKLLNLVFEEGLISSEHQSHFSALRKTLEAVPTIRNKNSAHGQGAIVVPIPRHLAAYALHMTASAIIFLVEAAKEEERKQSFPEKLVVAFNNVNSVQ